MGQALVGAIPRERVRRPTLGPAAVAAATALIALCVAAAPTGRPGDPNLSPALRGVIVVAALATAVVAKTAASARQRGWLLTLLASVLLGAGAAILLNGAPYPPFGWGGDQTFRMAIVERFSHTLTLGDATYKGLAGFYPPLFFEMLGRVAAWFGLSSGQALKIGTIGVAAVAPLWTFRAWSSLTRDSVLALAVALAGIAYFEWYEPYAWIAVVAFVPWWLHYVRPVTDRVVERRDVVIGALIGGVLLATYYTYFFVGAVELAGFLTCAGVQRLRKRRTGPLLPCTSWLVLGGSAIVSSPYWLPLALSMTQTAGSRPLQNRFFAPWMTDLPTPFLGVTPGALVMLCGLVFLVVHARTSPLFRGLAWLLVATYAWLAIGLAAAVADTPLLAWKAHGMIDVILTASAGLGIVDLWRRLRDRPSWTPRIQLAAGIAVIALGVLTGASTLAGMPYLDQQRTAGAPTAVLHGFDRIAERLPSDPVVLSDRPGLEAFRPVHLFNAWNAHYSHPAGLFDDRIRFLRRLTTEDDPAVVAAALHRNRFDRVDALLFRSPGDALRYRYGADVFPLGTAHRELWFSAAQFAAPYFHTQRNGDVVSFVPSRRSVSLSPEQHRELEEHFPGDLRGA